MMRKLIYACLLFAFFSCKTKKEIPDVSGIKIVLQTERFEKDFFELDTLHLNESLQNLHKKYHGYTVAEAVKATDKNGVVMYKIHAKRKKSEQETIVYELHYALSGKLISKKKDKEIYYDGSEKSKPKPTKSNDGHGGHQH